MMRNKTIFSIIIIFILSTILFASFSKVQASALVNQGSSIVKNFANPTGDSVSEDIKDWNFSLDQEIPSKVIGVAGAFIAFLRNASAILTVLVITGLGIKYMLGSVQEKAEYKKSFLTIIIGVSVIALTTAVVDLIFRVVSTGTL